MSMAFDSDAMEKPPPPPDLEDVYRPFEDPGLRTAEEPTTATSCLLEPEQPEHELGELGDLLGMGGPAAVAVSSNAVVDLSQAGPTTEKAEKAEAPGPPRASPAPPGAGQAAMKRIPANAKGFGSDDLFGAPKPKDDSIFETVCKMLPEQVTSRVECLQVSTEKEIEVQAPCPDLSAEHAATAANRTVEGRWVPTYMRQQLAAGGHTSLPTAPNGHEFSAHAQPPSCGQAFLDMGQDFGEGAQAVLEFMAAFFTSLTFQCQACSHHAMSTAHEQVMTLGDECCGSCGYEDAEDEVTTAPNDWQAYRNAMDASNDASIVKPEERRDEHVQHAPRPVEAAVPCSFGAEKPEPKMEAGPVDKDLLMQVASAI